MMVMKECCSCRKSPLTRDEIGISMKLLGRKTKVFYCLNCLAAYLDVTVDDLLERIEEFKEEGCSLFS